MNIHPGFLARRRKPRFKLPAGATDAHCHVFGPGDVFPYAPNRRYTPDDAPKEMLRVLHDYLGIVALLGDSAHQMTPYMAQGAATSIEDAAVLACCLAAVEGDGIEGAFNRYVAHRKPRTSVIQAISSANCWMQGGDADTAWLYGYDAWNADLDQPASRPQAKAA